VSRQYNAFLSTIHADTVLFSFAHATGEDMPLHDAARAEISSASLLAVAEKKIVRYSGAAP
jgi:hypothetical protein